MKRIMGMCLDWRVLGALAVIALAVWAYAPQLVGAAIPVLVLLICPLSMTVMALSMRGSSMNTMESARLSTSGRLAALERERARIEAEIARARAETRALTSGEHAEVELSR